MILKWSKDLNRHLTEEDTQMSHKHMKINSTSYYQGSANSNNNENYCTPNRRPKSTTLTAPKARRMRNNRNTHLLLVGMLNGTATLEDVRWFSYKTKLILTKWSNNHVPRYLPREMENLCLHKTPHMAGHRNFFIIGKSWKQSRCPSVGKG